MNKLTGKNKSFPLTPAKTEKLTVSRLKEAITTIAFNANHGGGGMFIATFYAGKINVTRFENVTKMKLSGFKYNPENINDIIDDTVFNIKHSMNNPALYSLEETFSKCRGKILLVALVTPLDLKGNIVADDSPDVQGWDILIHTVDGADIDVFCAGSEPLAGTISVTGNFGRSAIMPYLYFSPNRQFSLWRLFALVTGKELPRFLFNR